MDFMLEAQTTEQIAEVLQRLVTVHNCCLCILYWKEVWKECSTSTGECTGRVLLCSAQCLSLYPCCILFIMSCTSVCMCY